jgi:hypothetical protein
LAPERSWPEIAFASVAEFIAEIDIGPLRTAAPRGLIPRAFFNPWEP